MTSEYLPGAVRDDKPNGGTWTRRPAIGVLHSTEGSGWPAYSSNDAPHLTVSVTDREVRQHVPFSVAARSLKNKAGGVQTNRAGAIQVEVIGTCDVKLAHAQGVVYLPDLDDDDLAWLGTILADIHAATGVPLTSSVEWRDYKAGAAGGSYGVKNGLRLGERAWAQYTGWLGHMHVPENDHGDPGSLDVARILEYARADAERGTDAAPTPIVNATPAVYSTPPAPATAHRLGAFPLPSGHWYGTEAKDSRVHSGYYPADRPGITQLLGALRDRGWKDVPAGDRYTDAVEALVRAYQGDAHLTVDGKAGVRTWTSISQSSIR